MCEVGRLAGPRDRVEQPLVGLRLTPQRRLLVGRVAGDPEIARHRHPPPVVHMPGLFERASVQRDALADQLRRGELVEQQVDAAPGAEADRLGAARRHP